MTGDSISTITYTCAYCGTTFERRAQQRGRKPKYCKGKCRTRAYEERQGIVREWQKVEQVEQVEHQQLPEPTELPPTP